MTLRYGPYSIGRLIYYSLIGQALTTAIRQLDDATVLKTSMLQAMLHDFIVTMGINADVMIMPETVVHDTAKDTMSIGITGNTMDYMIGFCIIKPLSLVDLGISWFGRSKESKVTNHLTIVFNHKASVILHVSSNGSFRRVAFSPLVHIPRLPHNAFCSIYD